MQAKHFLGAVFLSLFATAAISAELSNGPGDGSVSVGVDEFGSFGSDVGGNGTDNAVFDPVGSIGPAGTTYQSGIAVSFGGTRPYLSSGTISGASAPATNVIIGSQTATTLESSFTLGSLDFQLSQSLNDSVENGNRFGSILNQVYTITNRADVASSFDIVRYIDGDLNFDGTIDDGGGRIVQSGNEILFETDAGTNADDTTTFLGITGVGGIAPTSNRFEVSSFPSLGDRISNGGALTDLVQNDSDGDGFIDTAFDVTMALRNEFLLGPGESTTYTTQTLFGNAVPPAPGEIEALPLLPTEIDPEGAFLFDIDPGTIVDGEIVFIDPDIAIGYTYAVTGASFASVQAPSLSAVPDTDGYLLAFSFNGTDFEVAMAPENCCPSVTSMWAAFRRRVSLLLRYSASIPI